MQEQDKKIGQIIAKAWTDEAFKQRLLADATAVFKEEGVSVPEGVEVKAFENTEKVVYLVLPVSPVTKALGDAGLDAVSGGLALQTRQPLYTISLQLANQAQESLDRLL